VFEFLFRFSEIRSSFDTVVSGGFKTTGSRLNNPTRKAWGSGQEKQGDPIKKARVDQEEVLTAVGVRWVTK